MRANEQANERTYDDDSDIAAAADYRELSLGFQIRGQPSEKCIVAAQHPGREQRSQQNVWGVLRCSLWKLLAEESDVAIIGLNLIVDPAVDDNPVLRLALTVVANSCSLRKIRPMRLHPLPSGCLALA